MSSIEKLKELSKKLPTSEELRVFWTWWGMLQIELLLVESIFPDMNFLIRSVITAVLFVILQLPSWPFRNPYTYYYGWFLLPIPPILIVVGMFAGISSNLYLDFLLFTVSIPVGLALGNRPKFVNMPKHTFVTYFMILITFIMYQYTVSSIFRDFPKESFKSLVFCVNALGDCKQDKFYEQVFGRTVANFRFFVFVVLYNVWRSATATEMVIDTVGGGVSKKYVRNGFRWQLQENFT